MKTKEELNALKNEVEALNKKLGELNEEELAQVGGGFCFCPMHCDACGFNTVWSGSYPGQTFDCPKCGEHAFHG